MKASQLISKLSKYVKEHGDLPVNIFNMYGDVEESHAVELCAFNDSVKSSFLIVDEDTMNSDAD